MSKRNITVEDILNDNDIWVQNRILDRLLKLIMPFVVAAIYLAFLYMILGYDDFLKMGGFMLMYLIPPAGKESVIPLGIASGLPWWIVPLSTGFMDFDAALFMAWNFDIALKIPFLGRWIRKFIENGHKIFEEKPWIEKLSFVGIVLFVMFPLQGSGGIGGSIVGRMIGMKKRDVIVAIAIGGWAGSFLIAIFSEQIKELFERDVKMAITVLFALAILALTGYIIHRMRHGGSHRSEEDE